jgi:geranylgeranyl pyrophosphate synthase
MDREVDWLGNFVKNTGSLEHAARAAKELADAARREFEVAYADAPEGPDKIFIRELTDYMIRREA